MFGQQVLHDAGVEAGEFLCEQAAAVDFVCAAVLQSKQVVFQAACVGEEAVRVGGQEADAVHADEYGIRAVHAGAGHDADVELGGHKGEAV